MIEVKLYDRRVTEESVPKMIEALTQALAETSGADPAHIQVVIQGVDPRHWGIAGSSRPDQARREPIIDCPRGGRVRLAALTNDRRKVHDASH